MSVAAYRRYRKSPKGLVTIRRLALESGRRRQAFKDGCAAPPRERDCPPRPEDGRCQCCSRVRALVLDHDHLTGDFRGWICALCNSGIAYLGDELAGLQSAVTYMERHYAKR